MYNYFKSVHELERLFQQAIDTLRQQGFEAANIFFEEAFRHDPYNLSAHVELAIYYATVKNKERFTCHFLICCHIDGAYREIILGNTTVVLSFSQEEMAEMLVASKEKKQYPLLQFVAISPMSEPVFLHFDPSWKIELEKFYHTLDLAGDNCFAIDKGVGEMPASLYQEVDFTKIDAFRLHYKVAGFTVSHPPECLHAALRQISYCINDVRFLIMPHGENYMDEVEISNGILYVYRHLTETDFFEDRLEYLFQNVWLYPDEELLVWVYHQYLGSLFLSIEYGTADRVQHYLDKINLLPAFQHTPKDPWLPYAKGKWALKSGNTETALNYFKEAAGSTAPGFEVYRELGKLQAVHATEYPQSVHHLTLALEMKNHPAIYPYRALAWCKMALWADADRELTTYIDVIDPRLHEQLIVAGNLFFAAGFPLQAATLLQAAHELNRWYGNELTETKNNSYYLKAGFYDKLLSENAQKYAAICAGFDKIKNNTR